MEEKASGVSLGVMVSISFATRNSKKILVSYYCFISIGTVGGVLGCSSYLFFLFLLASFFDYFLNLSSVILSNSFASK